MLTAEPGGSPGILTSTDRATLADAARPAARLAFAALIILSPFRARIDLVDRPVPPLYGDYTDFLLFWSDIALVATLVFWAFSLIARPRTRLVRARVPVRADRGPARRCDRRRPIVGGSGAGGLQRDPDGGAGRAGVVRR